MYCNIKIKENNYQCYYNTNNKKDLQPLILLHGWGVDASIYNNLIDKLNYYVITMDFLGFGNSSIPKEALSLDDYVSQLHQLIEYLKLPNVILVGHSFGGRVAIKYNYSYNLNKMVLVDAAGIRHKSFKLCTKIIKYKILKRIFFLTNKQKYNDLVDNSGSNDYKKLCPIMKQTMSKVIREDLRKYCKYRKTKAIILWGCHDLQTPLSDSYIYYNLFQNSKLIIFYKSEHFPFIDEEEKFIRILNRDINE